MTWFRAESQRDGSADISIFSEIGGFGVTVQDFHNALKGLGTPRELRIAISSDGGDVSAGFAIFNMLSRMKANKVVTIEGLAASMASVIAMVGDEVVMPSNSMMMIHNPWGAVMGESDQIVSFGEALAKMQRSIADAYAARTGISRAELTAMMDKETWLDANEAVSLGFADRIEGAVAVNARRFDLTKFNHVPTSFGRHAPAKLDTTKIYQKWNAARSQRAQQE